MFASILAYGLSLLSAITLWALVGVGLKFLILAIIGLALGKQKLLLNLFRFMPPADFVSSTLHGMLAFWFGTVLLGWFGVNLDYFLSVFLSAGFLIVDIPRIQKPLNAAQLQQSQALSAQLGGNADALGNMFKNFSDNNPQLQQIKQNMRNSKIIVLIGKLLGVALGYLNLLY